MNPIWVAAIISFLTGLFGYFIARFWVRPIGLYRRHKRRLALDLTAYAAALDQSEIPSRNNESLRSARKAFDDLLGVFHDELPHWYRLVLVRRLESPLAASQPLLALSNIRNPEHAAKRLEEVRKAMRME
jgi:hypothetical protein